MIRRLLWENIGWKLLSLAIAVLLWMAVVGDPELTTSISAPVEYKNLPRDLEISSDVLELVHLELRGPSWKLAPSSLLDTVVILDLSPVDRAGERTFSIGQQNVTVPTGVTLVRSVPAQIRVRLERRVTRKVPVLVRYSGPPPAGYRVTRQQVEPQTVGIIGPESRVNQTENAQTDPIDLSAVVGQESFQVHTYVGDPQVRLESAPTVTVKVELEKIR